MPIESFWGDVLDHFKADEPEAPVLFVIEDGWVRRTLAAWKMLPAVKRPDRYQRTALDWNALWVGVEFDLKTLADHLDTWEGHARQLFERARGLRLIYPDGSVHSKAEKLIADRVREETSKASKRDDPED